MVNVIKPSFVAHEDDKSRPLSILSAEVSPDGSRLATGGLDQKIKIWNTAPILVEAEENNSETKKLLSTLGAHTGNVLCVRWSPDGTYLASGSDDNIVIVWEKDDNAFGRKVFGQAEENHEVWKAVGRLVGHESDVSSLAWSKDGYYLATGGSDTKIMIWETQNFTRIKTIAYHQGFVKGLAFDPVGELLASQADDQSACIWRTTDWSLIAKIEEPFYNSPNASWFRRLSWSPEGTFLAVPNSINNGVFVAGILKRREWDAATSLVGHDNVIDVTAFNPMSFIKDPMKPPVASNLCSVLAVAARSCISVWLTSQVRPIVVFDTIVDRDTLDLSWSSDGTTLYACSSEGHIAVMQFGIEELGHVAPPGAQQQYLGTWGFQPRPPLQGMPSTMASGRVGTAAAPNVLMARPKKQPRSDTSLLPIPPQGAPQHITRTKEGKRRIQPTFLGLGGIVPRGLTPAVHRSEASLQPPFQVTAAPGHADQYMRREDVEMMDARMNVLQHQAEPSVPQYRTPLQDVGLPSWAAPRERPVEHAIYANRKRKAEQMDFYDEEEANTIPVHRPPGRTLGGDRPAMQAYTGEIVELRPAYIPKTIIQIPAEQLQLAVPAIKTFSSYKWDYESDEAETLQVRNFAETSRPTEVSQVNAKGKVQWLDYLPGAVAAACFCPLFAAVSGTDNTLNVYSPSGRRLLPTMLLDSPAAFVDAAGDFLLVLSSRGTLHIWDIRKRKSAFRPTNVHTVLANVSGPSSLSPIINTAKVRSNGCPMLSLSTGVVVAYDQGLDTWTQVTSTWWSKGSEFWEGRVRSNSLSGRGIIKILESEANDFAAGPMGDVLTTDDGATGSITSLEGEEQKRLGNEEDWKQALSLGHLESRMAAAVALDSISEYKMFLSLYAKKLAEEAFRGKAEELVKDLLGPVYYKNGKEESWQSSILGAPKHQLLKSEVLNVFAKSKAFTKLASDTADLLKKMTADA